MGIFTPNSLLPGATSHHLQCFQKQEKLQVPKLLFSFPFDPAAALGCGAGLLSINPVAGQDPGAHTPFLLLSTSGMGLKITGTGEMGGDPSLDTPEPPTTHPNPFFLSFSRAT